MKKKVLYTEPFEYAERKGNDLGVRFGTVGANGLYTELVMLAQPAGLRLFIAEGGRVQIIQLGGLSVAVKVVFKEGPCHTGGALGL